MMAADSSSGLASGSWARSSSSSTACRGTHASTASKSLSGLGRGVLQRHARGQQLRVGSRWCVAERGLRSGDVSLVEPHLHFRAAKMGVDGRRHVGVGGAS